MPTVDSGGQRVLTGQQQQVASGYGFGYDVRDLAAWAKTEEGWQYGQSLMRWQHENLVGRPGVDYDVRDIAMWMKTPTGKQWQRENLFGRPGIDYDVRDLAMAAKLHPEWFVVTQPQPQPQSRAPFVDWEQPSRMGVPLATWQAPGGYVELRKPTVPEQISSWASGIGKTLNPRNKRIDIGKGLEDIASSFAFRTFWDPEYNKRVMAEAKADAAFYATPEGQQIHRQQTELFSTAVGVGLIAYTAYDVGRNLYNIVKYRDLIREPLITFEGPEVAPEKFQVIGMSGPKGERVGNLKEIIPEYRPVQDTFAITPTRGVWSKRPFLSDTRGSMVLPSLLEPGLTTLTSIKVPFGSYEPWLTTEFMLAGMGAGRLAQTTITAPKLAQRMKIQIPRPSVELPSRLRQEVMIVPGHARLQLPSLKPSFLPFQGMRRGLRGIGAISPIQEEALVQAQIVSPMQVQRQQQSQIVRAIQRQIQRQQPIRPPRLKFEDLFGKRRRDRLLGSQWWFKRHPIPTPKFLARTVILGSAPKRRRRTKQRRRR